MKQMITSYLASPQGQEMIREYLSSPEGQKAICEFTSTKKGRAVMKKVLPGILSLSAPPCGCPVASHPDTQRNSLEKTAFTGISFPIQYSLQTLNKGVFISIFFKVQIVYFMEKNFQEYFCLPQNREDSVQIIHGIIAARTSLLYC